MKHRRLSFLALLAALGAAGVTLALSLAPAALAWSPSNLPPGWSNERIHAIGAKSCEYADRIWTAGRADWSPGICEDSPSFQADFDAWVDAHYTAPAPPSTTPPATVTVTTTTTTTTTTTPATTSTSTSATTTDATSTAAPPATSDSPSTPVASPAPEETTSTTSTTTADLSPELQELSDRLDEIARQIAALSARVQRVEVAGDASWVAYLKATASGANPAAAASIARSTYLNAIYGLGAFAA